MSKKTSRPPQRKKSSSPSREKSAAPVEKKHVSPQVAALILVPVIAMFCYFGWTLIQEATRVAETDPDISGNSVDQGSSGHQQNVSLTGDDLSSLTWETDDSRVENWDQIDDASRDGWNSEVFTVEAGKQLDKLKKLLIHPEDLGDDKVRQFAAEQISIGALRPVKLDVVFDDKVVQVERAGDGGPAGETTESDPQGYAALIDALRDFSSRYSEPENLRIKIKVFRIENKDNRIRTRQTVEVFGKTRTGLSEENLTWVADWNVEPSGKKPLLTGLAVNQYEGVRRPGKTMFSDCTESVLGHSERFQQQLMKGYNYWLEQTQFKEFYTLPSNPGVAIGDVNHDGLEDIYICQEVGLPNLLYLQNPDGSLRDYTRESGVDWIQNCRTALIVDWDNDGNNDLAVAATGGVVLAKGDGTGKFRIQKVLDTSEDVLVLTAADYDLDGRLDLFVGVYFADRTGGKNQDLPIGAQGGAIDSNDGGRNSMLRNETSDGQWSFRDVTEETGFDANNHRYAQAASWEDFDNDGDPDLYVANDFGLNNFYRNDLQKDGSRKFIDIAPQAGVQDQAAGMSAAWGDYDRDGWMDLYVSNMYSYAGNRIAFQDEFKPNKSDDVKQRYQRFARGNTFFRNPGISSGSNDLAFEDLSVEIGVNRARWAWGSRFIDLNNDGWEDLVVANGYITSDDNGDL